MDTQKAPNRELHNGNVSPTTVLPTRPLSLHISFCISGINLKTADLDS